MRYKKGDRVAVRIGLYLPPMPGVTLDTWVKATVVRVGKGDFKAVCDKPFDGVTLTLVESPVGDPAGEHTHRPLNALERLANET